MKGRMDPEKYVVSDPKVCGGEPVMKGTRVPLKTVIASLEEGDTAEELMADFPSLTKTHIRAARMLGEDAADLKMIEERWEETAVALEDALADLQKQGEL